VVADALICADPSSIEVLGFVDDQPEVQGATLLGLTVVGPVVRVVGPGTRFHVAIGAAAVRERLQRALIAAGASPLSIVHPRASVSAYATVGDGTFVAAGAIVAPMARVAEGVIVNHGAVVDHDCVIGAWAHIAPNATLGGAVHVGTGVLVGAGSTVLPGRRIGDGATIGAGAVVVTNVSENETSIGVPSRTQKEKRP
jgi:sugar O-acyltransferase (sialic acid O-acetyltransferase NeuD family)